MSGTATSLFAITVSLGWRMNRRKVDGNCAVEA
jgi:hypothetical protein